MIFYACCRFFFFFSLRAFRRCHDAICFADADSAAIASFRRLFLMLLRHIDDFRDATLLLLPPSLPRDAIRCRHDTLLPPPLRHA